MKHLLLSAIIGLFTSGLFAQKQFTHADTLRGSLSPLRSCYDVNYYDLRVRVNIDSQFISGSNMIRFKVVEDMSKMQIDLFANMKIEGIYLLHDTLDNPFHAYSAHDSLGYTRDGNAVFIDLKKRLKKGELDSILILYSGHPTVAKHAPWDGGFVWKKDKDNNPWVGVACEGVGASLWWPCKDHLTDKPDSMRMRITVAEPWIEVSNGKLEGISSGGQYLAGKMLNNFRTYNWFISYPINLYNVTLNIGKYTHFTDQYISGKDTLPLDYYVLPYNLDKAKEQFKQVKPMMQCYEKYLGRYPFWRDGYKLVETPYLGMEHQSAIAYGNEYKTGYAGMDYSGIGLKFDYIIIHESAHEWWGNNVSAADRADMWIHEGFASYTEAIYTECMYDSITAQKYVIAQRRRIENKEPIIGPYGVNYEGDGDMYPKGMQLLNTLRFVINNDSLWWSILRGIQKDFSEKPTNTNEIVAYFNEKTGRDLTPVFDQYLKHTSIPILEYKFVKLKHHHLQLNYQWLADEPKFNMPVRVTVAKDKYEYIRPHTLVQTLPLNIKDAKDFKIDTEHFYIKVSQNDSMKGPLLDK